MVTNVHPTAVVDPTAELAEGVEIGPYAVIGAGVKIGARSNHSVGRYVSRRRERSVSLREYRDADSGLEVQWRESGSSYRK